METIILFILIGLVVLSTLVAISLYFYLNKSRRSKDVERSLKLVPLLLKIPPREASNENRDIREAIKENISKAEGIFRLLSGISTKKSKLYGQRYISFEVVAHGRQIFFYVATPASLLEAVKKALSSGYPGIQIEQAEDDNFFSKNGKIQGVSGGEFELSQSSYYPINTYQLSEQDAFSALLSGISNLSDDEGAAMQLLIRPANKSWLKKSRRASKGYLNPDKKYGSEKMMSIASDVAKAPFKSASDGDKPKETKQPDTIDQKKSEIIEEKSKYPVFETIIRS